MIVLPDTHLLIWLTSAAERLSKPAAAIFRDPKTEIIFSAASIWEIAVKRALDKPGFRVDPRSLRVSLIERGYRELAISGNHGLTVASLPKIHGDPFDRILIAQAIEEGLTLLTADKIIAKYPGPIQRV